MEKKQLRSGFTTGTCAAAAAKAAAVLLFTGEAPARTMVITPKNTLADLVVIRAAAHAGEAICSVIKDAGDDPDVTHGAEIRAAVRCIKDTEDLEDMKHASYESERYSGLFLCGGEGIGLVTRNGLACPVGMSAINPVPRAMIFEAVGQVCEDLEVRDKLLITISIPDGVVLAKKTFNPKLGIVGGISVLGTSGVVEPMSEKALLDTIALEIHMKAVEGRKKLILTPGNYGETFLKESLGISLEHGVKCSNFIGAAMELSVQEGMETVLLVGHIGKLIKVAGGMKNTHSRYGDGRMESLWSCISCDPVPTGLKEQILNSNTTEEALGFLEGTGILKSVMDCAVSRIQTQLKGWTEGKINVEVVTFSKDYGILGRTPNAGILIREFVSEMTE